MKLRAPLVLITVGLLMFSGCSDPEESSNDDAGNDANQQRPPAPEYDDVYGFADECVTIDAADPGETDADFLAATDDGDHFAFDAPDEASAARVHMKATDLGRYLLFDDDQQYLVAGDDGLERKSDISSDVLEIDDDYLPGVQFDLEPSPVDSSRFRLRHHETTRYLATTGLTDNPDEAAVITIYEADGCADYPGLTVDAEGDVEKTTFEDGDVFGFVETHSHLLTNFGFGGAGMFHGAPFHPLGVEHALPSCEQFHGEEGRADLFGYGFEQDADADEADLLAAMADGELPNFNHHTEGYPEFTDWPSAHDSSTHQTQYYKWLERAWRGGLRLMVQHATSNQVICEMIAGEDIQPTRYSCNDMVAVDRTLEETRRMERYIDAQHGGPGEGWFRIVESPEQARQVIEDGDLAIVLGIEVSNLFDCNLVRGNGESGCDQQDVVDALDEYHDRGVRALFPVHKFDNAFSAGDGHREVIEVGNFAQTGHYSNFTEDCPDVPAVFDQGDVAFGDLNEPREQYFSTPPADMTDFGDEPLETLGAHAGNLLGDSLEGDYCQNAGLTDLGEFLIEEIADRGMILEIDHLPQRSYERAFEILRDLDYPAVGSHGSHNEGELYELGGVSKFNFAPCSDPDEPGTRIESLQQRLELMEEAGAYLAEGFGFDLNGFAGAPGPRFGDDGVCDTDQQNPVEYPFDSYGGDVTLTEPRLGERTPDFNTEGLVHIGLVPELIEDVRNDGVTDEQLEPLFRSAEGYLRMWERAESRSDSFSE